MATVFQEATTPYNISNKINVNKKDEEEEMPGRFMYI